MKTLSKTKYQKGYTLVELIVSMVIALIMLGILAGAFVYLNREYNKAWSATDMERELQAGIETIRRDLKETSVNSIRIYPAESDELPGVSMISAEYEEEVAGATKRYFKVSRYGQPKWSGFVFYTLVPVKIKAAAGTAFEGKIGNLVRWRLPVDKLKNQPTYPFPTDIVPESFKSNNGKPRIILRGIPMPDSPPIKGMERFKFKDTDYGGFQVAFIYQKRDKKGAVTGEFLSNVNPALTSDRSLTDCTTELVQVNFIKMEISDRTGKVNADSFSFQVHPRH